MTAKRWSLEDHPIQTTESQKDRMLRGWKALRRCIIEEDCQVGKVRASPMVRKERFGYNREQAWEWTREDED